MSEPGIEQRSSWHTIEGVALIILGVVAILAPIFAAAALAITLGILLIVSGIFGLVSAVSGSRHAHVGWSLASSIIALVVGLILVFFPVVAAAALAILLGAYLLLDGIAMIGLALDHRKRADRAWGWLLAVGILDLVLAVLIFVMGAIGEASLIGFIIGLDLILAGAAMLALHRPLGAALSLRR